MTERHEIAGLIPELQYVLDEINYEAKTSGCPHDARNLLLHAAGNIESAMASLNAAAELLPNVMGSDD